MTAVLAKLVENTDIIKDNKKLTSNKGIAETLLAAYPQGDPLKDTEECQMPGGTSGPLAQCSDENDPVRKACPKSCYDLAKKVMNTQPKELMKRGTTITLSTWTTSWH